MGPTREYRAAGGVVLDDAGQVLLLERWIEREGVLLHEIRLPKGHVEPGETDLQAAQRETCEESGYCGFEVLGDLGIAFTEWDNPREHVSRTEHYYLLRLTDGERGQPDFQDPSEALFRILWAQDCAAAERLLTYDSEKQFAARARALAVPQPPAEDTP